MREIAKARIRYKSQGIFIILRREDWSDNHKCFHRLYCMEGLNLRANRKKDSRAGSRGYKSSLPHSIDQCWSMDFVSDQLFNARHFHALTIVDNL
jgi:putative transposase